MYISHAQIYISCHILSDIKAAIRYAKAEAIRWGADPDKIFLYGCSAGARASAWATDVPGNGINGDLGGPQNIQIDTSGNNAEFDAKVTSLFMLSGEFYVPHLNCDLYACSNDDPRCIEPNELVVSRQSPLQFVSSSRCNYAVDPNEAEQIFAIQKDLSVVTVLSRRVTLPLSFYTMILII